MSEPKKKEYSLKPIESQMIKVVNGQHATMLSNILSYVAVERLAYNVTEDTHYEISPDLSKFTVWEEKGTTNAPEA